MALTDENNMIMPVAPMNNGGFGGNGFGNGDGWWILLLFLLLGNNGWGNGFGGSGNELYPWMNQAEITTGGFQNQLLNDNVTGIRDNLGNISTQLCNGFSDVQMAISGGFAQAEIADNARQIANMQQAFNSQTAVTGAINNLGTQLGECLKKIFNKAKKIFNFTYETVGTYA